jgi:hypothetical protein
MRNRLSVGSGLAPSFLVAEFLCSFFLANPSSADSRPLDLIEANAGLFEAGSSTAAMNVTTRNPASTASELSLHRAGAGVPHIQVGGQTLPLPSLSATGNEGSNTRGLNDAHVGARGSCTDQCKGGYAANGSRGAPQPSILLLVGSALAGLGAWTRRRFQAGCRRAGGTVSARV